MGNIIAFGLSFGLLGIPVLFAVCGLLYLIFDSIKVSVNKHRENRKKQYVRANSILLKEISELNAEQSFIELKNVYAFDYSLKTKRDFDKFDPYDAFCNLCYRKSKEFNKIAIDAIENRKKLEEYEEKVSRITQRLEKDGLGQKYFETELATINDSKLTPVVNPQISILYEYRTPKEIRIYHRSKEYGIDEVKKAVAYKRDVYVANAKYIATVQHEDRKSVV